MFTGIVFTLGKIVRKHQLSKDFRLVIRPNKMFENVIKGESISVNGACLSVESFTSEDFTVYASEETINKTTLSTTSTNSFVNLERALAVGERFGGHIVSGHVDCLANVDIIEPRSNSLFIQISYPEEFSNQIIKKGSITLDGISVTVNQCGKGFFNVNIIPETISNTTIKYWLPGHKLNMETDIIGKYVENLLGVYGSKSYNQSITEDFLKKNGFL